MTTPATLKNATSLLQNAVRQFQTKLQRKYGIPIFHVYPTFQDHQLHLHGQALHPQLWQRFLQQLPPLPLRSHVQFITDLPPRAWAIPRQITDLCLGPHKPRQSQALPQEGPIPLLDYPPIDDFHLSQLPDGTIGWLYTPHLTIACLPTKRWTTLAPGETIPPPPQALQLLRQQKNTYLHTPYLWGGRSQKGIDCSALVQAIYREAFQILLPRHSADQMRCGIRVPPSQASEGDLVFARSKTKRQRHVGIFCQNQCILHACLKQEKVLLQPKATFTQDYHIHAVRRILL